MALSDRHPGDNQPGSKRVALVAVIAPVVAILAITLLLYFSGG